MRKKELAIPDALAVQADALTADFRRRHERVDMHAVLLLAIDLGLEALSQKQGFPPRIVPYLRRGHGPAR